MAAREAGKNAPAPGESEFSHGAGLTPQGATRYVGNVAGQTLSEPDSKLSRRVYKSASPGRPV